MPTKPILTLVAVFSLVAGLVALGILATEGPILPPHPATPDSGPGPNPRRPVDPRPFAKTHPPPAAEAPRAEATPVEPSDPEAAAKGGTAGETPRPAAPPAAAIHGIAKDASPEPRPVGGARVVLTSSLGKAVAITDPQGRFRFAPLPPGDYLIRAFHADFAPWVRDGSGQRILLGKNQSRRVDVTLEAGVRVEGIVIARDGSGPVGDARVTMVRGAYDRSVATTTRPDGAFTFAHFPLLPPNEPPFPIEVIAAGFAPKHVPIHTRKPGESHRLEILLDRGAGLLGLVTDSDGTPLPDVDVRCRFRYLFVKQCSEIAGRTDNLGRYRLKHLPRGYTIQVWAFKKGYRPSYLNLIVNGHAPEKIMRPLRLKRMTKS